MTRMSSFVEDEAVNRLRSRISRLIFQSLQEHQTSSTLGTSKTTGGYGGPAHANSGNSATATPEESHATPGPAAGAEESIETTIQEAVKKLRGKRARTSPVHSLHPTEDASPSRVTLPVLPPLPRLASTHKASSFLEDGKQQKPKPRPSVEYKAAIRERRSPSEGALLSGGELSKNPPSAGTREGIPESETPKENSNARPRNESVKPLRKSGNRKDGPSGDVRLGTTYDVSSPTPYDDEVYTALYRKYLARFSRSVPFNLGDGAGVPSEEGHAPKFLSEDQKPRTGMTPPASGSASGSMNINGGFDYNMKIEVGTGFKAHLELEAAVAARGGSNAFDHMCDWLQPPEDLLPDSWGKPMSVLESAVCLADSKANRVLVSPGVAFQDDAYQEFLPNAHWTSSDTPMLLTTPLSLASPQPLLLASPIDYSSGSLDQPGVHKEQVDGPRLTTSAPPNILAGFGSEWVSVTPSVLPYWEFAQLLPFSTSKTCHYVVLCPNFSGQLMLKISEFMQDCCALFDVCGFGSLKPAAVFTGKGILNLDTSLRDAAVEAAQADEGQAWRRLLEVYRKSISVLYQTLWTKQRQRSETQGNAPPENLMFFVARPTSASVWTMHLFSLISEMFRTESSDGRTPFRVHLQVIELDDIIDVSQRKSRLQRLCISVFYKLQPGNPEYASDRFALCEPVIALDNFKGFAHASQSAPGNALGEGFPHSSEEEENEGEIMEDEAQSPPEPQFVSAKLTHGNTFHLCTAWSDCGCWLTMAWVDSQGVFLQVKCHRVFDSPRFYDAAGARPAWADASPGTPAQPSANDYGTLYRNRQERHRSQRGLAGQLPAPLRSPGRVSDPLTPPAVLSRQSSTSSIAHVVGAVGMSPSVPAHAPRRAREPGGKGVNERAPEQPPSGAHEGRLGSEVFLSREQLVDAYQKVWDETLTILTEYLNLSHALPDAIVICKLGDMCAKEAEAWQQVLTFGEGQSGGWGRLVVHPSSGRFGVDLTTTQTFLTSAHFGSVFVPKDQELSLVSQSSVAEVRAESGECATETANTLANALLVSSTPLQPPAELLCAAKADQARRMHAESKKAKKRHRQHIVELPPQDSIPVPFLNVNLHGTGTIVYDHVESKSQAKCSLSEAQADEEDDSFERTNLVGSDDPKKVVDEIVDHFERLSWVSRTPFSETPMSIVPLHIAGAARLGLWLSNMDSVGGNT